MIYFYYIITKTFQRSVVSDFTFGGLTSRVLSAFVIDTAPFHIILLHWDSTDYHGIMARKYWNFSFSMSYEMKFKAAIRGHHVYKATWSPVINEVLICRKDNREEAQEYDSNAVGVYKDIAERDDLELAGHVPVELSRVLVGFLASNESNSLPVQVCGKRKREVGLVIPGCYNARTSRKKIADILSTEIKNIKERYPPFELEIEQDATRTPVLIKQERK